MNRRALWTAIVLVWVASAILLAAMIVGLAGCSKDNHDSPLPTVQGQVASTECLPWDGVGQPRYYPNAILDQHRHLCFVDCQCFYNCPKEKP